ncbi:MAG TPA: EAL domain-containing protein [Rhodanobacter sp.]|nr:EAL domain-containing protein [Rhodanobacter sp.]
MQSRLATTIALGLCVLAIVVPIAAALSFAHRQSIDEATRQAANLASGTLQRTEEMADQGIAAYRRLQQIRSPETCSDAKRSQLRAVIIDYDYVRAVGYVSGNRITCSAVGARGDGFDMGPPSYVSRFGVRIYTSVVIEGNRPLLVMAKDDYAVAIHPESLLSRSVDIAGTSQGVYGESSRQLLAHSGFFDPRWLARKGDSSRGHFFDGSYLVVLRASNRYDMASYAAIPLAHLNTRLRAFALILMPIGLVLGIALVVAIVVLTRQRASLPAVLRAGLRQKQFVLYYQPVVELDTGNMAGAEALLRWPANREVGMRPGLFMQAAEECGLIQRFTEYVLKQVAIDGPRFFSQHPGAYISVNLSSADLHSDDVVTWLRQLVATPGIAPYNLVVEVTEHSFVDPVRANRVISRIRELGVRVAIDDFGTGFSSLSHLNNLRADYLKIDKVFVDAIGTGSVTSEVVLHIIDMAKSLNLTLISEGVETRAQADFLLARGVPYAQGWLFSKAVPLADLLARTPAG